MPQQYTQSSTKESVQIAPVEEAGGQCQRRCDDGVLQSAIGDATGGGEEERNGWADTYSDAHQNQKNTLLIQKFHIFSNQSQNEIQFISGMFSFAI